MPQVKQDKVQIEIEINGKKVKNTLRDLRRQYRDSKRDLAQMTVGTEEFIEKQQEIAKIKGILDKQRIAVAEYARAIEDLSPRSILALTNQAKDLREEIDTLDPSTQAFVEKSQELGRVEADLAGAKQEAAKLRGEINLFAPDSIQALEKKAKDLDEELAQLSPTTQEFVDKSVELVKVKKRLEEVEEAADKAGKAGQTAGDRMRGSFKKFSKFLKTNILGIILSIIAGIGKMAVDTGKSVGEFDKIRGKIGQITGATGEELSEISARVKATANTFDQDLDKVIRTTNATAKTMGIEFKDALDLVNAGLIVTQDKGDEFLEQAGEYSIRFRKMGLDAEQSFALTAKAINDGVLTDKAPDALKEFDLSIKNLAQSQRDIMIQTFGPEFTGRIEKGIESGKINSIDALSEISGKLNEFPRDSAATQRVIDSLFKAPGEDAADFILAMDGVSDSVYGLIDPANSYTAAQLETLSVQQELTEVQERLSFQTEGTGQTFANFGTKLKVGFLRIVSLVIDAVKGIPFAFNLMRVKAVENLNVLLGKATNIVNGIISVMNKMLSVIGQEIDPVEFKIDIATTSEELIQQRKREIEKRSQEFAQLQEKRAKDEEIKQRQADQKKIDQLKQASAQETAERQRLAAQQEQITREVQRNLQDLAIEAIDERHEREIAKLRIVAQREIEELKGSETEKLQQTLLIRKRLHKQIEQIESEAHQERILLATQAAQNEIQQLTGSRSEIAQQRLAIESRLNEELLSITETFERDKIQRITESAQEEILALTGSETEISQERLRILTERDNQISTIEQNTLLRRISQIRNETETEISALTGSTEEVQAARTRLLNASDEQIAALEQSFIERRTTAIQQQADQHISLLTGSESEIAAERLRIISQRDTAIANIESISSAAQVTKIHQEATEKIAALTGSEAEITAARTRIEQDRDRQIAILRRGAKAVRIDELKTEADQVISESIKQEERLMAERIRLIEERESLLASSGTDISEEERNSLTQATDAQIEAIETQARILRAERQRVRDEVEIEANNLRSSGSQDLLQLDESTLTEIANIEKESFDNRIQSLEQHHAERKLAISQQVLEEALAGTLKESFEKTLQERLAIQHEQYLSERMLLEKEYGEDDLATQQEIEDLKLEATKKRIDAELTEEERKGLALATQDEDRRERREKLIQDTTTLLTTLQEVNRNVLESQVSELEENKRRELDIAGNNVERREQIEVKFQQQKKKLEEESLKRQRIVAIAQKAIAIREVIISTKKSIAKTLELGIPAALPFIAVAAALGAAQVAAIATQKFETGGRLPVTPKGGTTQGPSHSQGGIKMVDSQSGNLVGEVEGGEPILSIATYKNNREVVDRLLYSSMFQGGKPIHRDGGILGAPTTTPSSQAIERSAEFSDANIVRELQGVKAAIQGIKLQIGEEGAVALAGMANEYADRTGNSGL